MHERFKVYGGVVKSILRNEPEISWREEMNEAIQAVNATKALSSVQPFAIGEKWFSTLVHFYTENGMCVGNLEMKLASKYVNDTLLRKRSDEQFHLARTQFACSSIAVSATIFENFGHKVLSGELVLRQKLKYRNLETGENIDNFTLFPVDDSHRVRFGTAKDFLPKPNQGVYYQPSDPYFPAIDSFVAERMYQFTISLRHPIKDDQKFLDVWEKLDRPPICFVVPESIFQMFKKQTKTSKLKDLKQHVLGLPID